MKLFYQVSSRVNWPNELLIWQNDTKCMFGYISCTICLLIEINDERFCACCMSQTVYITTTIKRFKTQQITNYLFFIIKRHVHRSVSKSYSFTIVLVFDVKFLIEKWKNDSFSICVEFLRLNLNISFGDILFVIRINNWAVILCLQYNND